MQWIIDHRVRLDGACRNVSARVNQVFDSARSHVIAPVAHGFTLVSESEETMGRSELVCKVCSFLSPPLIRAVEGEVTNKSYFKSGPVTLRHYM